MPQLSQIIQSIIEKEPSKHLKRLNSLVRHARDTAAFLKFPDLDRNSLRLAECLDVAYKYKHDLSSELAGRHRPINLFNSKAMNHDQFPVP